MAKKTKKNPVKKKSAKKLAAKKKATTKKTQKTASKKGKTKAVKSKSASTQARKPAKAQKKVAKKAGQKQKLTAAKKKTVKKAASKASAVKVSSAKASVAKKVTKKATSKSGSGKKTSAVSSLKKAVKKVTDKVTAKLKTTPEPKEHKKVAKQSAEDKKPVSARKDSEDDFLESDLDDEEFGGEEIYVERKKAKKDIVEDDADEEVIITDAEGRRYCRVRDCDQLAMVDGYCRYHYLLFWKKIQVRKKILTEGKLERYIEELTARYPDKFLDMLKKDLRSEKEFLAAIQELEIDENSDDGDFEDETQNFIDEVRGVSDAGGSVRDDDDY